VRQSPEYRRVEMPGGSVEVPWGVHVPTVEDAIPLPVFLSAMAK